MGAIAIHLGVGAPEPADVVQRMGQAVPHRGARLRFVAHGRSALCSVNPDDEDEAGVGMADGLAVAFAGVLDNAAQLHEQLGLQHNGGSPADLSTVLAAGYRAWGRSLPTRMRGVFAGAISDGQSVFCFRDHIGYRPLFYRRDANGFFAATEAKQVIAGAGIPKEPDLDVVHAIFFRTLDDETPAALRGVRRLAKSSSIAADDAGLEERRYWRPEDLLERTPIPADELQPRFDALMDQAVTRCLTGRDAISLSGGIDSPAVTAYAAPRHRELYGEPLQAVSVVYPRYPSVDESRYVMMLASHYDIPLQTYEQTANPVADLRRWTELTDTPWAGAALAQYEEDYRRIRALGRRTVLTGEHAEHVVAMHWYTLDHYLTHGRFRAAWRDLASRRARGRGWLSLARLAARSLASDRLIEARDALRGRATPNLPDWIDARRVARGTHRAARERWRLSQLSGFIGPGVSLEAEEVCQAVTGVRSRKPWTDVDLWEFFLGMPAEQKYPDIRPKGLVRDLLRGRVPDVILDRTDKTVFDEAALAEIDYPALRALIGTGEPRLDGVDYDRLFALLDSGRLGTHDYRWARTLASVHAFLSQWS